MGLRVDTKMAGGNAGHVEVVRKEGMPEVHFSPLPKGGSEALWFRFAVHADAEASPPPKIRISLRHVHEWADPDQALRLIPVYSPSGQGWHRCTTGELQRQEDGRMMLAWTIPYPAPRVEVALCFPFDAADRKALSSKCKGYWREDVIGVSEEGVGLHRWSNDYGSPDGRRQGLYLLAGEYAADTPGQWVWSGCVQQLARVSRDPFLVWTVPVADPDAAERGVHGRSVYPLDIGRAWCVPPLRHEVAVYQQDLQRWSQACKPVLVLNLRAAPPFYQGGVYATLPAADQAPDQVKASEKWAHVIQQELGATYADTDFKRVAEPDPVAAGTCLDYATRVLGVSALSLHVPFNRIGTRVLAQKQYREIGEQLAKALLRRQASRS